MSKFSCTIAFLIFSWLKSSIYCIYYLQDKYQLTEDEARRKMEDLKLKEEGIWDEDKQRGQRRT